MDLLSFLLCWSPVILLTVLAVVFRRPALELSIYGSLFSLVLVVGYFHTPLEVVLLAAMDGALTTLPLTLVILAGILLSTLLSASGSLQRIVDWFMSGVRDGFHRILLITLGLGNFMEGAGVIAEPVVAPMLAAAGVAPGGAAALSIVGYAGLMTLEMSGIVITVLSLVTSLPTQELGLASAWLSLPATLAMAACLPLFLDQRRWATARQALPPLWSDDASRLGRWALILGCALAVAQVSLAAAAWVSVTISGMLGGLALVVFLVLIGTRRMLVNSTVLRDLAPFALLLAALLLLNTIAPLKELTARRLVLKVAVVPNHTVLFQPLYSGYLYLLLAFFLAARLLRVPGRKVRQVVATGLAMGIFGAMGQIIAYCGYGPGFGRIEQAHNVPHLLASGLAAYTGSLYPIFVPLLGWVGTFLTGYGVASLMLFGQLQVTSAAVMGVSATWLAAGLAVGSAVGSISSTFKIAIATPMCGAVGQEGDILRLTIPLGVGASLLVGLVLWVLL